ncbi:MAG: HAD family hydrolase [Treponema sp.]|nr:HAD family hydrolase [Treponema sp.]
MFEYYFFDLDGTLTDSSLGILNSYKFALKKLGFEIPDDSILRKYIGPPLLEVFMNDYGMTQSGAMEAVKVYREYFSQKGIYENQVYPGIQEMLAKLKEKGKKILLATSKPEKFAKIIIEYFHLDPYFDYICGSNGDESRGLKAEVIKYALETCGNPDKAKVLMVGDRNYDVIGAKENGLKSCGVLFGFGSREELEDAGADFIVESPAQLADEL